MKIKKISQIFLFQPIVATYLLFCFSCTSLSFTINKNITQKKDQNIRIHNYVSPVSSQLKIYSLNSTNSTSKYISELYELDIVKVQKISNDWIQVLTADNIIGWAKAAQFKPSINTCLLKKTNIPDTERLVFFNPTSKEITAKGYRPFEDQYNRFSSIEFYNSSNRSTKKIVATDQNATTGDFSYFSVSQNNNWYMEIILYCATNYNEEYKQNAWKISHVIVYDGSGKLINKYFPPTVIENLNTPLVEPSNDGKFLVFGAAYRSETNIYIWNMINNSVKILNVFNNVNFEPGSNDLYYLKIFQSKDGSNFATAFVQDQKYLYLTVFNKSGNILYKKTQLPAKLSWISKSEFLNDNMSIILDVGYIFSKTGEILFNDFWDYTISKNSIYFANSNNIFKYDQQNFSLISNSILQNNTSINTNLTNRINGGVTISSTTNFVLAHFIKGMGYVREDIQNVQIYDSALNKITCIKGLNFKCFYSMNKFDYIVREYFGPSKEYYLFKFQNSQ